MSNQVQIFSIVLSEHFHTHCGFVRLDGQGIDALGTKVIRPLLIGHMSN